MKVLIGANGMGLETHLPELRSEFPGVEFVHEPNREKLKEALADVDVYMGWINRDAFLAAKQLKWIQSPSSGANYYVAIPELVASDVLLTSAVGTHSSCLADSIFAMLLSFTRGIRQFIFRQQKHEWSLSELRNTLCELTNQTIGLIGFGSVGRATARRAQAFDMRILAVDAYPGPKPDYVESLEGLEGLPRLLAESDVVVVTVPYTKDTDHMIGAEQIAMMKKGAYLIAISRGKIVDEDALVAALHSGQLAGAAADVFAQEPLPKDSPLWDEPNLLITPHAAGGTQYEGQHVIEIFRENLGKFLAGQLPLRNQVNKQLGW
ncbi:MAG: D-2-hydroxyacid dehydrogenase [Anaerolineae bacterium]|jgi:phosphoglycerate dehydrogenase-like enzyme|nr:D-2-hydroxyacid dehydrogenase [Chloroflexota bacterium]